MSTFFHVSFLQQEKDLSSLSIHPHWLAKEENEFSSNESLFQDLITKNTNSKNTNHEPSSEVNQKLEKRKVTKRKKAQEE